MYKISLAGDLGSGKSTVSAILMDKLGAEYYSTGTIVRNIASKYNMSVADLNVYMQEHPEIDREIDDGLVALSDDPRMLIIDSRMAWHFTRGTFKVYMSVDPTIAATRIMCAHRINEHNETLEETVRETARRRASERLRYSQQYGVDITDLSNYSLVVDTSYATPEQIAEAIISGFEDWKENKSYKRALISPSRMKYPDETPDMMAAVRLSNLIDEGESVPEVRAVEKEGCFYAVSGAEVLHAYSLSCVYLAPVTLVKEEVDTSSFVEMRLSL